MLPLSLYIHTPWCIQKCPYCDFNSHQAPQVSQEKQYVDALIADLKTDLNDFPARPIQSIFIGGGTPSLLSSDAYATLFEAIRAELTFAPQIEITLEANPGTIDQARFREYRALGINRLSLGVQSFHAKHLKTLGRIHDDTQAHRAIDCARDAGFDNLNIDLMHSLPHQTVEEGLEDLAFAIQHAPEHLSWYQLTIEPNTVFYKTQPPLPQEDAIDELEQSGLALLASAGYHRYEISAFCQPNRQAAHNLNYWLFGDYLGIGAGAHGKWTCPVTHKTYRTRKQKQPRDYLNPDKPHRVETITLTPEEQLFEFMLNTTRLEQPIPIALLTERTGLDPSYLRPKLAEAKEKNLISYDEASWQITPFGRRYTNDLQALFLTL